MLALPLLWCGWTGIAVQAQAQTPPNYDNRDENGVDRVTGRFTMPIVEGSIGGDKGVSMVRYSSVGGDDNWSGALYRTSSGGSQIATLTFGKISERFTKVGGTWTPDKANGATLVENIADVKFTYRAPDGTVITYVTPESIARGAPGGITSGPFGATTSTALCAGNGSVICGVPTGIVRPDGQSFSLTWTALEKCVYPNNGGGPYVPGGGPGDEEGQVVCTIYSRLSDVRNNSSYAMKVKYQNNSSGGLVSAVPPSDWFRRATLKFLDLSQVYCDPNANDCDGVAGDWETVSYPTPSYPVTEIVNNRSGTWRIDNSTSGQIRIRRPGAATDTTIVNYTPSTYRTNSLTRDGETITYNWATSGSTTTSTATTGAGETSAVTSTPTAEQPVTVTAGASATTSYVYDANKRLIRETRPEGDYTEYTRDARGNVTQTRVVAKPGSGLADIITTANYDATCINPAKCNNPNWTQDALGNRTDYTYDTFNGEVTRVQMPSPDADAPGSETGVRPEINYSYQPLFAQVKSPGGALINTAEAQTKLVQVTSCSTAATCAGTANETKVTIEYNSPNLQPTKVTTAAGDGSISSSVSYAYDTRDNLVSVDGPLPGSDDTTTYIYDPQDRQRGVIGPDPDGAGSRPRAASRYTFDTGNRVTKAESGTVTDITEAALNAMTVFQTLDISYDANGNKVKEVVSGTAGAVSVAQYSYDSDNRLLCTALRMNPASWGALPGACTLATTGADGPDRISRNNYDDRGRVTKVESAVGTAQASDEVRTAYTANGRLDHVIDAENNRTTYIYDGFDRLSQTRYPVTTKGANSSNASDYEQLTYDARSSVISRRLRDGNIIGYTYDDLGQLRFKDLPGSELDVSYDPDLLGRISYISQSGHTLGFWLDALGRVTQVSSPLGTTGYSFDVAGRRTGMTYSGSGLSINYDHDVTGNVTAIRENGATSGVGVLASYAFDALGRRFSVTFGNGSVQSFAYDAASRLSGLTNDLGGGAMTHDLAQTFGYNPAGQIANVTRGNDAYAWGAHYNVDRNYVLDGLNRVTSAGAATLGYDARGNLTSDGVNSYAYSSENMLTSGPGGTSLIYDPANRLYQTAKAGVTTRFQYDGIDLIAEYDGSNNLQRRYVHGPGIDNPIVWYEGTGTSDRRFLMADERGSVVSLTDSAGATIAINSYDEYGIPAPTNIGRFGYTGQAWIPELKLWYYKARIYSPTLGRFMQTDPIGYADGMNWYNYVGGDPVNFVDPLGLQNATITCDRDNNCVDDKPIVVTARPKNFCDENPISCPQTSGPLVDPGLKNPSFPCTGSVCKPEPKKWPPVSSKCQGAICDTEKAKKERERLQKEQRCRTAAKTRNAGSAVAGLGRAIGFIPFPPAAVGGKVISGAGVVVGGAGGAAALIMGCD